MGKKVITPEFICSYPHLFKANKVKEDDEPKYSCACVFLKGTDITPLKEAVLAAAEEEWGNKVPEMIQNGKLVLPFRKDGEEKGYPEGSIFINARSKDRPGIVSVIPDPATGKPMPITDESQVYAGMVARASLVAFTWEYMGRKGVSFALNNIQKLRDGERLDGRVKAEDEFDADENAVADISDLTGENEEKPAKSAAPDLASLLA